MGKRSVIRAEEKERVVQLLGHSTLEIAKTLDRDYRTIKVANNVNKVRTRKPRNSRQDYSRLSREVKKNPPSNQQAGF